MPEPLDEAQRQVLEQDLLRLRETLVHELHRLAQRATTVELDQAAMGRVSRGDALQQQAMAQAEQRRLDVRALQVKRAILRLKDDTYGECVRCGDDIGFPRLKARPEAPFCLSCADEVGA
ncbi:MAG: TraR/DksA family transcriptional regulator [Myxococcota bacterium]